MAVTWADVERQLEEEFEDSALPHRVCSRHGWDDRQQHWYLGSVWRSGSSMIEGPSAVKALWGSRSDVVTCETGSSEEAPYFVSSSGQVVLPASALHRWNLDDGGPVDVIDLGFAVLTLPPGEGRRLLSDLRSREDHAEFVRSLAEDPDLATT